MIGLTYMLYFIPYNYGMPLQASNVFIVEMIAIFGNFKSYFFGVLYSPPHFFPQTHHSHMNFKNICE
jgi:hypothetical protein